MERRITWYDILGVPAGAEAVTVQREYSRKTRLLRSELLSGAPSAVVTAASRAQEILDMAWQVLSDPVSRERYDEAAGLHQAGEGLARRRNIRSEPGWRRSDLGFLYGGKGEDGPGALRALTGWLAPRPRQPRQTRVPNVLGLFYTVCLEVTGRLGLRLTPVRLTEHPMPVDGLVVHQSPPPSAKIRRGRAVTVHVWHPPDPLHNQRGPSLSIQIEPPRKG
jgi:hypothetical protein